MTSSGEDRPPVGPTIGDGQAADMPMRVDVHAHLCPAEVPDFFIVRPLVRIGRDANGRPIFKGERMRITIQDVIAAEGPRLPDVNHSQRHFNTGIVVIVEHGRTPSAEIINRANGIRRQWIDYWAITTGRRASMTVDPH